ncbi:hypothetical protein LX59_00222 [Azomonas agilis]|uniref:Uncharacterized protein n=1 Tax=Azomonas agilis TaxID=116849 RepID=A0A562J3A4_9GAMM|nr:hypothetical protein [Azomonas agilis]TWH77314.1 hypothetical protein LX59_00222 [Azomonas agilis]
METNSVILHSMLAVLFTGFMFMGIGFNFRERTWGIVLLAMGSLIMLSTIAYRIHLALS